MVPNAAARRCVERNKVGRRRQTARALAQQRWSKGVLALASSGSNVHRTSVRGACAALAKPCCLVVAASTTSGPCRWCCCGTSTGWVRGPEIAPLASSNAPVALGSSLVIDDVFPATPTSSDSVPPKKILLIVVGKVEVGDEEILAVEAVPRVFQRVRRGAFSGELWAGLNMVSEEVPDPSCLAECRVSASRFELLPSYVPPGTLFVLLIVMTSLFSFTMSKDFPFLSRGLAPYSCAGSCLGRRSEPPSPPPGSGGEPARSRFGTGAARDGAFAVEVETSA